MSRWVTCALVCLACTGCDPFDPNRQPHYAKENGLPRNCRAYVQFAIESYRAGLHTADQSFAGLEQYCGVNGIGWGRQ